MKAALRTHPRPAGSIRALAALLLVVTVTACRASDGSVVSLTTSEGRSVNVTVEIARTSDELRRGLMWRDEMPADHGMLFVFPDESERTFWMKNTPLPLDIVYIDSSARVVSIAADTTPYSTASIPSRGPARYVLEVHGGFCRKHAILPGSPVRLPAPAMAANDDDSAR